MKAKELILECMVKENAPTKYRLAQIWDMHSGLISDYMSGKRIPDEYACFRIAQSLGRDPATIIAEINAEKTGKHRAYFVNFLSRRGMLILLAGVSLSSYSDTSAAGATAATLEPAHNVELWRQRRRRARQLDRATKTALGRFFYARRGGEGAPMRRGADDAPLKPPQHGCYERHQKPRHPLGLAAGVCVEKICQVKNRQQGREFS